MSNRKSLFIYFTTYRKSFVLRDILWPQKSWRIWQSRARGPTLAWRSSATSVLSVPTCYYFILSFSHAHSFSFSLSLSTYFFKYITLSLLLSNSVPLTTSRSFSRYVYFSLLFPFFYSLSFSLACRSSYTLVLTSNAFLNSHNPCFYICFYILIF